MYVGVLNLYDLTFILLLNQKVSLAISYKNNGNSLFSLLNYIHLDKLICVVEPILWSSEESEILVLIDEFTVNTIKFGIPLNDMIIINDFCTKLSDTKVQMINILDCLKSLNSIPTFAMARRWGNQYSLLSFKDNELSAIALCDSTKELYDLMSSSGLDSVYNESDIIDIFKIKARYP